MCFGISEGYKSEMLTTEPETCMTHAGSSVEFWHQAKKALGCGRCLLESGEPLGSWVLIEEALPHESSALAEHLERALETAPGNLEYLTEILEGLPEDAISAVDRSEYFKILTTAQALSTQMSSTAKALRQLASTPCDA
ncbi:Hypothetical protein, putative [Bodo saltans]|uniref:Uncharacterized protein n=1 Tax=Bodo saltans TaxID=75058 RepID=A0A0S4JHB8_BODSA|nr:Hypothetical protein, putative [Bodo saltans]|eukprot:CUG89521.1 Hypothetical protein, putative [Bodo saltans]